MKEAVQRVVSLFVAAALAAVSVGIVYGAVRASVGEKLHACCHHDRAVTPCFTLCATARASSNLGAVENWHPPALVPIDIGTTTLFRLTAPSEPPLVESIVNDSSPPIYVIHAVFLI